MKSLYVWCILLMVLAWRNAVSSQYLWKIRSTGAGKRFVSSGTIDISMQMISPIFCAIGCVTNPNCISFNYQASTGQCEMLNTAPRPPDTDTMVTDVTWNHYTFVFPRKTGPCPSGSVMMTYDSPVFTKYDPTVEGYACTDNTWILQQYSQGKTNCHMSIIYHYDFAGNDVNVGFSVAPYYEFFRLCLDHSCSGLVCINMGGRCWMKNKAPEQSGDPYYKAANEYWKPECS